MAIKKRMYPLDKESQGGFYIHTMVDNYNNTIRQHNPQVSTYAHEINYIDQRFAEDQVLATLQMSFEELHDLILTSQVWDSLMDRSLNIKGYSSSFTKKLEDSQIPDLKIYLRELGEAMEQAAAAAYGFVDEPSVRMSEGFIETYSKLEKARAHVGKLIDQTDAVSSIKGKGKFTKSLQSAIAAYRGSLHEIAATGTLLALSDKINSSGATREVERMEHFNRVRMDHYDASTSKLAKNLVSLGAVSKSKMQSHMKPLASLDTNEYIRSIVKSIIPRSFSTEVVVEHKGKSTQAADTGLKGSDYAMNLSIKATSTETSKKFGMGVEGTTLKRLYDVAIESNKEAQNTTPLYVIQYALLNFTRFRQYGLKIDDGRTKSKSGERRKSKNGVRVSGAIGITNPGYQIVEKWFRNAITYYMGHNMESTDNKSLRKMGRGGNPDQQVHFYVVGNRFYRKSEIMARVGKDRITEKSFGTPLRLLLDVATKTTETQWKRYDQQKKEILRTMPNSIRDDDSAYYAYLYSKLSSYAESVWDSILKSNAEIKLKGAIDDGYPKPPKE